MGAIIAAVVSLATMLIQDGIKANDEGKATDFAQRVKNLQDEWTRKQKADADFDSEFDTPGT